MKNAYAILANSPTARLDTQLLLCHVLGVERPYLVAHDDRILTADEQERFQLLVQRREQGEPIAYILGKKGFYDLEFKVTPAVLIPRPETEHLVEAALAWAQGKPDLIAADIGTGSGAIAVTFAKHCPTATVHAVDKSPEALAVARQNAAENDTRIVFHQGNLARPMIEAGIRVDLLMANLPYIRAGELPQLDVTKYEPQLALDGGTDGLDLVRDLLRQAPQVCHPGALILLEIGAEQGQAVLDFAKNTLMVQSAAVLKDYAGHDRVARLMLA